MKIIRQYQAFDGTKMVQYTDNGIENTMPLFYYKKLLKSKK